MVPLIGYVDRLSARPGEQIAVKVSSQLDQPYRADLVRIIHGDPNPAGPGIKIEEIPAGFAGTYGTRFQPIHSGSCGVVTPANLMAFPDPCTIVLRVQPWLIDDRPQTVLAIDGGPVLPVAAQGAGLEGRRSGPGRRADAEAALVRAAGGGRRRTVTPAADRIATQLGSCRFRQSRDDGGPRRARPGYLCRRADAETRATRQPVSRFLQWPPGGSRDPRRRAARQYADRACCTRMPGLVGLQRRDPDRPHSRPRAGGPARRPAQSADTRGVRVALDRS